MDGIRGGIPHLSASKNALYELKMDTTLTSKAFVKRLLLV
jgi:hypothetical protein